MEKVIFTLSHFRSVNKKKEVSSSSCSDKALIKVYLAYECNITIRDHVIFWKPFQFTAKSVHISDS